MSEDALKAVDEARDRVLTRGKQTIELDCPPGNPRPGDLIADVIQGTGLDVRESVGRCFGNWTWDYNDIPAEKWEEIKPILNDRISLLYNRGLIRYGSW
jgi:hypothetical protein